MTDEDETPLLIDPTIGLAGNINVPDFPDKSYMDHLTIINENLWQVARMEATSAKNAKLIQGLLEEIIWQVKARLKAVQPGPRVQVKTVGAGTVEDPYEVIDSRVIEPTISYQVPPDTLRVALMKNLAGVQIDTDSASELMELTDKVVEQVNEELS